MAVSDIYPMFNEPTITWVPSGFSGYIWLDTKIVFKKNSSLVEADVGILNPCGIYSIREWLEMRKCIHFFFYKMAANMAAEKLICGQIYNIGERSVQPSE